MRDDKIKKKTTLYIEDSLLHLIFSIDYESGDDHNLQEIYDRYTTIKDELESLTDQLNENLSFLETEEARLKSQTGEHAVNEVEIKRLRNEIFVHRKKHAMLEEYLSVSEEFERQEAKLSDLTEKENTLRKDMEEVEKKIQKDLRTTAMIETQLKEILSEIEEKEKHKDTLSKEVSALEEEGKVFAERHRLELELKQLTDTFSVKSDELNAYKKTVFDCRKVIPELNTTIASLQEERGILEEKVMHVTAMLNERESLKSEIEGIEMEYRDVSEKLEEAQHNLHRKQEMLNELSSANSDMKNTMKAIENEIARSEQKFLEIKSAEQRRRDSEKLNEDAIANLEVLLINTARSENQLSLIEDAVETIINASVGQQND